MSIFLKYASIARASLIVTALALGLAGCSSSKFGFPYRAGVQQGNWITKDQVSLLRPGMTREQVKFALGTPSLASAFHANRWDYPYYYRSGKGNVDERVFTVFFTDGKLEKWAGDDQPELQPFQVAREEVQQSQKEDAKLKLDAERAGVPVDTAPINVAPQVQLDGVLNDNYSDPAALPGTEMQAPQSLE